MALSAEECQTELSAFGCSRLEVTRRAVLLRRVRVSARARRQGLHCHGRVGFQPEPELIDKTPKSKTAGPGGSPKGSP